MLNYELVIFDFDGTLADSFATVLEAWDIAAKRHGFKPASEYDLHKLRISSAREILAESGLSRWKLPIVARLMRELVRERIQRVTLFAGMETLLRTLKSRGAKIAIVTSNTRENVEFVLGPARMALVDHLGCGASLFGKRAKTRSAIKACGVSPASVLCVGDEVRDAEVASGLELDFAAVAWGYTHPERLERLPGVKLCRTPDELLSLILA